MKYYINAQVINLTTDNDKLNVLTYLKDNYGLKTSTAKARGNTEIIDFQIIETVYNDMVATITALKAKYGNDLIWELDAQDYGG